MKSTMKSHPDPDAVLKKHIFFAYTHPLQEIRYPNFFQLENTKVAGRKVTEGMDDLRLLARRLVIRPVDHP